MSGVSEERASRTLSHASPKQQQGRDRSMGRPYTRSNTPKSKLIADHIEKSDEDVTQALVTAGAFVALADRRLKAVERDELVSFIDRQGFVSTASKRDLAEVFESRVRQLEATRSYDPVVEALRPIAGSSLSSIVVRTAERVAAADREVHPAETGALRVIRQILAGWKYRAPGRR
jgi:tellurite resistance protein TerB